MNHENPITPAIEQTIDYHTNRLARSFRLQPADKDDIRQELTLKALEAMQCHTSDMRANIETYTKQAICRRAIDLIREIIMTPTLAGIDTHCEIIASNPNADLIIDIWSIIEKLSDRQKTICAMLMAGHTQEEIASEIGIKQQNVQKHIAKLKGIMNF